jgi:hypothetical protein
MGGSGRLKCLQDYLHRNAFKIFSRALIIQDGRLRQIEM